MTDKQGINPSYVPAGFSSISQEPESGLFGLGFTVGDEVELKRTKFGAIRLRMTRQEAVNLATSILEWESRREQRLEKRREKAVKLSDALPVV